MATPPQENKPSLVSAFMTRRGKANAPSSDGGVDRSIVEALRRLVAGHWDTPIATEHSNSDVTHTLELIEALRCETGARMGRVVTSGDSVHRTSVELSRTSQDLYQEIGNFSTVLKTLSDSASEQAAMADAMKSGMADVSGEAARHQQVAIEATAASSTIRENVLVGQREIDGVMHDWENMISELRTAGSDISTFEGTAREIASIVEIIAEIAHRTNVLSLNAALEAERSGEAGEAFSVLATEIRGLSDTTRRQATEIGDLIDGFLKGLSTLLQRMGSGIRNLDQGAKAVATVRSGLGETVEGIEQTAKRIADMARGFEKLAERISSLQSQADDVERISKQHAVVTQQTVKQTRDRMLVGADQLLHESRNLDRVSSDLAGTVSQFRGNRP